MSKPIAIKGIPLKEYNRLYYYKRRQEIFDYLGGTCKVCGAKENLEVDHINKADKEFEIKDNLSLSNPKVKTEIDKCQLLCDKHHIEKTAKENSGFKHGTKYGWMRTKCPCDICIKAKRSWYDARNALRRKSNGYKSYTKELVHGTNRYYWRGCRCSLCRAAHSKAELDRRNRIKLGGYSNGTEMRLKSAR